MFDAQVSAFCITAAASRARTLAAAAAAAGGVPDPTMSSVFELEISSDSMSQEDSLEAQV